MRPKIPTDSSDEKQHRRQIATAVNWLLTLTSDLPVYADNAAALAAGLAVGDLYRTGADPDVICVIH